MNSRRDRSNGRIRVPIGIAYRVLVAALAVQLCIFASVAHAGDVTPGAIFIANSDAGEHGKWTSSVKEMATLEQEARFDEYDGVILWPKALLVATAGGAAALEITRPGFHAVSAPIAGRTCVATKSSAGRRTASISRTRAAATSRCSTSETSRSPSSSSITSACIPMISTMCRRKMAKCFSFIGFM